MQIRCCYDKLTAETPVTCFRCLSQFLAIFGDAGRLEFEFEFSFQMAAALVEFVLNLTITYMVLYSLGFL